MSSKATKRLKTSHKSSTSEMGNEASKATDSQGQSLKDPAPAAEPQESGSSAEEAPAKKTFKELGVVDDLCEACEALGYKSPTPIQAEAIPLALQNRDIIGLAETGSGKTVAFALPILQALLEKPQPFFGLVLAPTRELAVQIGQVFEALGSLISLRCAVIVGGLDMTPQAIALGKKPHIVVATPGRLLDHLEKTKGFSLGKLQYLVMDEADRLLEEMDFGPILEKILKFLPRQRRTFLFSATMTTKVERLQRASLRDPLRASVSDSSHQTVKTLIQNYIFIPHAQKDVYLVHLVNEFAGRATIIFARQQAETQRLAITLRALGLPAIPLHGGLSQTARLGALNKFKAGSRQILVATDVAARGLDIPNVHVVINYDLPADSKTYIHRVGRTARAGKSGHAIAMVTQYDFELWLRIEAAMGVKLTEYPVVKDEVMVFRERVDEAARNAKREMKQLIDDRGKKGSVLKGKRGNVGAKRRRDDMDAEEG